MKHSLYVEIEVAVSLKLLINCNEICHITDAIAQE